MRLEVERNRILLMPEPYYDKSRHQTDVAYIEEVLGLKRDGDTATVRRVNASNLSCIAYVEIKRKPEGEGEKA